MKNLIKKQNKKVKFKRLINKLKRNNLIIFGFLATLIYFYGYLMGANSYCPF